MDDGLIDGKRAMVKFEFLVIAEPEYSRVPIMIDKLNGKLSKQVYRWFKVKCCG